ncbi:MAG: EAL domain-containing protein [Marinobacterium sp.]
MMRIFIIDDDPFIRHLMGHQLSELSQAQVYEFDGGVSAMDAITSEHHADDLIICDLHMPDKDGVELVRELGQIGFKGGLVLVSGEDARILQTVERLAQGLGLRLLDALQKPVSRHRLEQILQLNRERDLPQARRKVPPLPANELKQALSRNELINHYQPKVSVRSGEVTGVETLVRWDHPRDGLIYPDRFIAQAEELGLMDPLTFAVLRRALDDAAHWHQQGIELQVAVNISMDNLDALDFPERIEHELKQRGLPPTSLMLEVTESRLMRNRLESMDILSRLRLKRVGLSIDDFGTGHSSLAQLRDLPFNELKIDQSFVHGASHHASLRSIFEGCLSMAQKLGLHTVAEGVEDATDWAFLQYSGCDTAQGWFIARAMPPEQLPDWLQQWQQRRAVLMHPAEE